MKAGEKDLKVGDLVMTCYRTDIDKPRARPGKLVIWSDPASERTASSGWCTVMRQEQVATIIGFERSDVVRKMYGRGDTEALLLVNGTVGYAYVGYLERVA